MKDVIGQECNHTEVEVVPTSLYFSTVFLKSISQLYFWTVFLYCMSQLYSKQNKKPVGQECNCTEVVEVSQLHLELICKPLLTLLMWHPAQLILHCFVYLGIKLNHHETRRTEWCLSPAQYWSVSLKCCCWHLSIIERNCWCSIFSKIYHILLPMHYG